MISPISFGSTYKKAIKDSSDSKQKSGYRELIKFCQDQDYNYELKESPRISLSHYSSEGSSALAIIVPDAYDSQIEAFCIERGINIDKYLSKDLMSPTGIVRRIKTPPIGYKMAYVNADRLNKLLGDKSDNNFEHCEKDYKKYFKKETDNIIRSADPIPAPTLYINSHVNKDQTLSYIKKYGLKDLDEKFLIINLAQRTYKPEHCLYFAMRDAGVTQIPVYVDDYTYEMGRALKIMR